MALTKTSLPKLNFHPQAYLFVRDALAEAQERSLENHKSKETGHISPRELLEGVRSLAQRRYGMMTISVFRVWGISTTADIGRIVFEMVDLGKMKKTDKDRFEDFIDVYTFEDAFEGEYTVDVSKAFRN